MTNVPTSYSISNLITGHPRSPVPDARYMALDSTMLGPLKKVGKWLGYVHGNP